jgi:SET domain-containing protein
VDKTKPRKRILKELDGVFEIKKSKIHGNGVFTKEKIEPKEFIFTTEIGQGLKFLRYLNHSCNPNCELKEPFKSGSGLTHPCSDMYHDELYAIRTIRPGWEITIDYRKTRWVESFKLFKGLESCKCLKCRGN